MLEIELDATLKDLWLEGLASTLADKPVPRLGSILEPGLQPGPSLDQRVIHVVELQLPLGQFHPLVLAFLRQLVSFRRVWLRIVGGLEALLEAYGCLLHELERRLHNRLWVEIHRFGIEMVHLGA
jgi:hypothetical protein